MSKISQEDYDLINEFWILLTTSIKEFAESRSCAERRITQWSTNMNASDDKIGINIGDKEIWLYIRSGTEDKEKPQVRTQQMEEYSQRIRRRWGDQQTYHYEKGSEEDGRSIGIKKYWERSKKAQWPHVAQWVTEQFDGLREIIKEK